MPLDVANFLERVEQARGLSDVQALILDLRDQYAVDHVVYHWVSSDGEQYGCGTYDPVWAQRYVD